MNVTLRIPEGIAIRLSRGDLSLERQALEALVVEAYRAGRIGKDELALALDLEGGDEIDGFLKARDIYEICTVEDVENDAAAIVRAG